MKIKKRPPSEAELSKIYDELYEAGEEIIKKYKPCKFSNGECVDGMGCCMHCNYLSKTGCTVKALACKLWLCCSAEIIFPKCFKELKKLKKIAARYKFLDFDDHLGYRESKEETMERLLG